MDQIYFAVIIFILISIPLRIPNRDLNDENYYQTAGSKFIHHIGHWFHHFDNKSIAKLSEINDLSRELDSHKKINCSMEKTSGPDEACETLALVIAKSFEVKKID